MRNKAATQQQLASDNIKNVQIFQGDITNLDSLKVNFSTAFRLPKPVLTIVLDLQAVASELQGQNMSVDYLICNAAYISKITGKRNLADLYALQPRFTEQSG